MIEWRHGHSFAAGGLAGLSLAAHHPWLIFAGGMAAGFLLTVALRAGRSLGRELRGFLRSRQGAPVAAGGPRPPFDREAA